GPGTFGAGSTAPADAGTVPYAKDAMSGLELPKQIVDPAGLDRLKDELRLRREKLAQETANRPPPVPAPPPSRSTEVRLLETVPPPPDFERHILSNTPLEQIWRFVNPVMLYGRHFGVKGSAARALETPGEALLAQTEDGRKALALKETLDALKQELLRGGMEARAAFRFFRAGSQGNTLRLFDGQTGAEATAFDFPRQPRAGGVCLADFVRPLGPGGEPIDNLCLFVVTAGKGIRALAERFKERGDFVKMHGVQALALETAEGYAELLHSRLRSMWGAPDRPDLTMLERFRAEYPGKRYSFGYPACPRLEDQNQLFAALRPEGIGVTLTEGCMIEPEASVSALLVHHPDPYYFSVR